MRCNPNIVRVAHVTHVGNVRNLNSTGKSKPPAIMTALLVRSSRRRVGVDGLAIE